MPLYFFHLRNGRDVLLDKEGLDLPDMTAVREQAICEARAIIAADAKEGIIDLELNIEVQDGDGAVVLKLPFTDAVAISRSG